MKVAVFERNLELAPELRVQVEQRLDEVMQATGANVSEICVVLSLHGNGPSDLNFECRMLAPRSSHGEFAIRQSIDSALLLLVERTAVELIGEMRRLEESQQ